MKENDALRKKEKENKIEIEILEANQDELAKRNNSNLKVRSFFLVKTTNFLFYSNM